MAACGCANSGEIFSCFGVGEWKQRGIASSIFPIQVESTSRDLVVRIFSGLERRGILLVIDLFPSLNSRLAVYRMTPREVQVFR